MASLVGQESVWKQCQALLETPCHIYLTGSPGSGKSTLARELLQLYAKRHERPEAADWTVKTTEECLLLGPDQDRGIQTIRGYVSLFIRQRGLGADRAHTCVDRSAHLGMPGADVSGGRIYRWVLVDDVDTFPQISQQALRRPMESYSHITRFLFIGTSFEDLIPALRSRCIHISMNTVNPYAYTEEFERVVGAPRLTDDMWSWVLNITNSNISALIRLLSLIRDVVSIGEKPLSLRLIQVLCSAPFYMDFFPLLNALAAKNVEAATAALLAIWRRGYTFEDILESLQTIHEMFGGGGLDKHVIVHKFLINAWTAYCKGNTSVLALQGILWRTVVG